MEFSANKPIFLQIYDFILEQVLTNQLEPEMRIPSVRDLGAELGVNPNTVVRAYTELQNNALIIQQRGIGYFITANAKDIALTLKKENFIKQDLPQLIHQMQLLNLTWEELKQLTKSYSL